MTTDHRAPTWPADSERTNLVNAMHRTSPRRIRHVALLAGVALIAGSCAEDKPLNTWEPRGPLAQKVLDLMYPVIWVIMGIVFVGVVFGTLWLTLKNRVKPEDFDHDDLPEQIHGNPKLEWGWTAAPAVLLGVIAVFSWTAVFDLEKKNDGTQNEVDVMVIGQQWWFEYRYDIDGDGFFRDADGDGEIFGANAEGGDIDDVEWPLHLALDPDDLVIANQLVIPVGQQVDLWVTSRDVIHSYWLPRLNGKRDTVPGRLSTWAIEASEVGEYNGWCTEYCGLSHSRMRMSAVALEWDDYQAWLDNQIAGAEVPTEGTEEWDGYQVFQAQCMSCHVVNDGELQYADDFQAALTAGAAPNLTKFATRTAYAGAIYSQYAGVDVDDDDLLEVLEAAGGDYLSLSETLRFDEAGLRRWISNAPEQKPMSPDDQRGMPAFPGLTDDDLEALVAYLHSLD